MRMTASLVRSARASAKPAYALGPAIVWTNRRLKELAAESNPKF